MIRNIHKISLLNEVRDIPIKWKDIILRFVSENPESCNVIEQIYLSENTIYNEDIQIFPPRKDIFRCFHFLEG